MLTPLRQRKISLLLALIIGANLFSIGVFAGIMLSRIVSAARGDMPPASETASLEQDFAALWDAYQIVQSRYVYPVDAELLVNGAISGMVAALEDEYSWYIEPDLCARASDFSGEFSGIGVTVRALAETGAIEVVTVIPGSPAEAAGVMPGDIFYAVEDQLVAGMTQAKLTALVPGPAGTIVRITFQRGADHLTFAIKRDVFELPNVSYELLDGNIAYLQMLDFNDRSRAQFDAALAAVDINDRRGMIFDMRGNPGGTLASAVAIGSAFIEEGALLRQVARDGSEEVLRALGDYADINVPIAVLIDESSASASEVIAGALQDHGVATLIGESTLGKGTVQNIVPGLANGGCLRITVKQWLRSDGSWIHKQGVSPDIIVPWNPQTADERDNDLQLEAAIAFLLAPNDS